MGLKFAMHVSELSDKDLQAIMDAEIPATKTTGEDTDVYLTEDEWEDMVHQQECAQAEIDDLRQEIADLKAELEDR